MKRKSLFQKIPVKTTKTGKRTYKKLNTKKVLVKNKKIRELKKDMDDFVEDERY